MLHYLFIDIGRITITGYLAQRRALYSACDMRFAFIVKNIDFPVESALFYRPRPFFEIQFRVARLVWNRVELHIDITYIRQRYGTRKKIFIRTFSRLWNNRGNIYNFVISNNFFFFFFKVTFISIVGKFVAIYNWWLESALIASHSPLRCGSSGDLAPYPPPEVLHAVSVSSTFQRIGLIIVRSGSIARQPKHMCLET